MVPYQTVVVDITKLRNIINPLSQSRSSDNDKKLAKVLQSIFDDVSERIEGLNTDLNNKLVDVYRENKQDLLQLLKSKMAEVDKGFYRQPSKVRAKAFFHELLYALRRCSPQAKPETEEDIANNCKLEQEVFEEQKDFDNTQAFIDALKKIGEECKNFKEHVRLYFVYAWPDKKNTYYNREEHVQQRIGYFHKHLKLAGINTIKDTVNNFTGSNLVQFMGRLESANYVLLLGTETFREKLITIESALDFEQKLLNLKRLNDLRKGNITDDKTTIIPYVLTGTRHSAFPDEYDNLDYKGLTIRTIKNYRETLVDIIADVYGVGREHIEELSGYKNLMAVTLSSKHQASINTISNRFFPNDNKSTSEITLEETPDSVQNLGSSINPK